MDPLKKIMLIVMLGRPQFMVAGVLLFAMGSLLAVLSGADLLAGNIIAALLVYIVINLSLPYNNEYYDVPVDVNSHPSLYSGSSGVLIRYPELRDLSKKLAITLISLSTVLGAAVTVMFSLSPAFFLLVLVINFSSWYYAAPPLRFAYRGLGEIATALGVGLFIPGMGYLALTGDISQLFWVFALSMTAYGIMFIINTEVPDIESDVIGKKRTFIVRNGRSRGFIVTGLLSLLMPSAYLALYVAGISGPVDFRAVSALSLIPAAPMAAGAVIRPQKRVPATIMSTISVTAIGVYILAIDAYLAFLILSSA